MREIAPRSTPWNLRFMVDRSSPLERMFVNPVFDAVEPALLPSFERLWIPS
jgi:hypothetical protein